MGSFLVRKAPVVFAAALLLVAVASPPVANAFPGSQLWVAREDIANFDEQAKAMRVSPDGTRVFVTGQLAAIGGTFYGTVAYDAATGKRLWVQLYPHVTAQPADHANALAVSPDGTRVFVTGESLGPGTCPIERTSSPGGSGTQQQDQCPDYLTIAYDASSGAPLWVQRYNGPGNSFDEATAIGVSPDGARVYVTGGSFEGEFGPSGYATIAYSAATGAQLWLQRYEGGDARALGVSPDGATVYVTGENNRDYTTIAYDALTGARLWVQRYDGLIGGDDGANALTVSRDGTKVFVTGGSDGAPGVGDFATVAYEASSGNQLWVARYNGPGNFIDYANAIGVSPNGTEVFVTGESDYQNGGSDYATVAYGASTGFQYWVHRYNGPGNGNDIPLSLAVSPDGTTVYVTGWSNGGPSNDDYATIAYDTSTGNLRWLQRYNGPGNFSDRATSLAVSFDGTKVFVTGSSENSMRADAFATIAYSARLCPPNRRGDCRSPGVWAAP